MASTSTANRAVREQGANCHLANSFARVAREFIFEKREGERLRADVGKVFRRGVKVRDDWNALSLGERLEEAWKIGDRLGLSDEGQRIL